MVLEGSGPTDHGKPVARRGRKATGPHRAVRQPGYPKGNPMRRTTRTSVVAALVLGLALPSAGAAVAAERTAAPGAASVAAGKGGDRPAPRQRTVRFTAGGTVTAVDAAAGTVTFTVKGGRVKALRGKPLTVVVAEGARITRDGEVVQLDAVLAGDRVSVSGVQEGETRTVKRVSASAAEDRSGDAPAPAPAPTAAPAPAV